MAHSTTKRQVASLLVGQSISFSIAFTSIFTQFLANMNVYLAFTQNFGNYFILSFFLLFHLCNKKKKLQTAWWKYIIVAIIDAEANFLIVKAYEYTTILSIMLCDAMTIPTVFLLSFFFLHSKFTARHYIAVLLCLIGIALMIVVDYKKTSTEGVHRITGDFMAIGAAILYSISNTCQEVLVKSDDWKEFLGMIGLGGWIVTLSQILIFERTTLMEIDWNWKIVGCIAGYVLCLVAMYVITATYLRWNDAVVFNMHLLTSDIIAAVLTYFFFDDPPTVWYFLALGITIVGVVIYNSNELVNDMSKIEEKKEESDVTAVESESRTKDEKEAKSESNNVTIEINEGINKN